MKNFKTNISISILLFINFVFTYKYSSRFIDFGFILSTVLLIIQILFYKYLNKFHLTEKSLKLISYSLLVYLVSLVLVSHYAIPLNSLNVDRWSVISSFLTELFNGNYPYYAKSHMGNYPGPMPFYFLISLPFYLIGELSILSCLGYCIMVFLIYKKLKSNQNSVFLLFFLFTSVYLIWEIVTRSNIFTFSVFIVLILNETSGLNNKSKTKFIISAILTGLLLSTRSVFILAYIIFFLSSLFNKEVSFKKISLFILIAFISFNITFLPLIILFKNEFFVMNPFIIQSSFLVPKFYVIIFILISILLSIKVKNGDDKFFYSGLSLFISILIYSSYHIVKFGFENSFVNSKIDISYFIFSIPFLILFLVKNKQHTIMK